jgi:hypothetical protein
MGGGGGACRNKMRVVLSAQRERVLKVQGASFKVWDAFLLGCLHITSYNSFKAPERTVLV